MRSNFSTESNCDILASRQEKTLRVRRQRFELSWWISIIFILAAVIILTLQLIIFSRSRATYPNGLTIADVSVGGMDREQAAERLLEIYNVPIHLRYNDALIEMDPAVIGFRLNLESMLATADLVRVGGPFWNEFWAFLWGNPEVPEAVPLDASFDETSLRTYLSDEIGSRYDHPATPSQPLLGTATYSTGTSGTTIDLEQAIIHIEEALSSTSDRTVDLPLKTAEPGRPSFFALEQFLKLTLDIAEFDGTASIYLLDLQTAQEIHFVYQNRVDYPTEPDLAFSASSIIKIPIMISAYRRLGEDPNSEALNLLNGMIAESGNDPADWLMEQFIDPNTGPLIVTEDLRDLGLENTFLAGHFRVGSPLMAVITTPANSRIDLDTDPDVYNQTTTSDIGMLLADLYQCAQTGGGTLIAVFPGEITQQECQDMIDLLTRNHTPFLIEAGAPDGTRIGHKHGWVTDNSGAISTIGDAGIVYTPSGNYVLVIYFYHPIQLVWDPSADLFGDLAKVVYNYYNLPSQ